MATTTAPFRTPVEATSFRRLLAGPEPAPDRLFFHDIWFKGHNNPRHARLLPRLRRLDRYIVPISDRRPIRGAEFRAAHATRDLRHRAVLRAASRRYRAMFTFKPDQIPYFDGPVVIDQDEPLYTSHEVALLNSPNVAAVVVCDEGAVTRYAELGLETPCHWIPQGVDLAALDPAEIDAVAAEHRDEGDIVVGYINAFFHTAGDRGHMPVLDVDHLLELWDEVATRVPEARLWLIGRASRAARARCEERPGVRLFEDIPFGGALPYIANFDIGLYPRRWSSPGPETPVKLIEYMGAGVPAVAYDFGDADVVRDAGAGLLCDTPAEFVAAVERLAGDEDERRALGEAARAAGAAYDWGALIDRYETEVLDRYLPTKG